MIENQNTEFKRCWTEDLKKTVVAFLNSGGGVVFIGVDDNGVPVGLDDVDDVMRRCSQSFVQSIRPDAAQFYSISAIEMDGKQVVRVNVDLGTHRPYYLGEKGLRPSGVFVRLGSTTIQAQESTIRKMVRTADSGAYENRRSPRQDLTFDYTASVFAKCGIAFTESNRITLGLMTTDGFFTNLGLLFSDQCTHSVKCAVFDGVTKEVFKDRREFGGSILAQVDKTEEYLALNNRVESKFKGFIRKDLTAYPESAVREAVLNAIVHRDYGFRGSVLVSCFSDRLEVVSPGGLVDGLSTKGILGGISEPRNTALANVFYRLKYIEAYGTGIPRMLSSYEGSGRHALIEPEEGLFRVVLENRLVDVSLPDKSCLAGQWKAIAAHLSSHPEMDKFIGAELLSVQPPQSYVVLEKLVKAGLLSASKRGKRKIYTKNK